MIKRKRFNKKKKKKKKYARTPFSKSGVAMYDNSRFLFALWQLLELVPTCRAPPDNIATRVRIPGKTKLPAKSPIATQLSSKSILN